jgi:hypothetical protein
MVKRILPLILALACGCAAAPPITRVEPVEVKTPVLDPVYCRPPALARPSLPVGRLTAASPAADTIRAYAATIVILKAAVRERDEIIAGCAPPPAGKGIEAGE